jgi:hypothetical protein
MCRQQLGPTVATGWANAFYLAIVSNPRPFSRKCTIDTPEGTPSDFEKTRIKCPKSRFAAKPK